MTQRLPKKDVVVVGLGWTGSILSYELARSGLDVVAIERGPWRDTATDFNIGTAPDELRYAVRQDIFLRTAQDTVTARNTTDQVALPIRRSGSFLLGNGVGGSGTHWNGQTWRFLPSDFRCRSHNVERYGAGALPADSFVQDWDVTYDELEPCYDQFERLLGLSGQAGNLKGQKQDGGNPFEGARQNGYPTPPMRMGPAQKLFEQAAKSMGLQPFPVPSANLSQAYTNTYGMQLGPCTYCGFCERFGCVNYSKSSPQTCVLPALMRQPGFEARTLCEVTRVNLSRDGTRATGVTYVNTQGEELEQPADIVLLCAYGLFNVKLMLLSGIGKPYDPVKSEGVVGRNYCYQTNAGSQGFFDEEKFIPFAGAGALGMAIDNYNGDNFDHSQLGFIGGANISCSTTNGRPILYRPTPPGTPRWGSQWKKATAENYRRAVSVGAQGSSYAYRDCYLDLDPTYKDRLGRPLMRMTFDFKDNELKMARYMVDRSVEIMQTMGAKQVVRNNRSAPWSTVPYQSTHNTGGAIMGADPASSAVNRYLQSWDVHNVFVIGASAFPQNAGYNPTGTVGALAYWAASAIRDQYLKNQAPLVTP